ncbi:hypothetical protein PPYR_12133 [Photinus pyralis]|nr:UNC93-like protein isoform X2 [Photinus pyralis]XP_031341989.1 UNC93-like protein isoform X2 [Photinus pyralis]XP_031349746.1 UNC93-like protein [Photinus pyralis]KAB0795294.1 hypothetical protein PPYR_12133 [Photinus pyralis]
MPKDFQKVKTTDTDEEHWQPVEKWRIWRNVLVLGFAFMIHFTAFWGASNLQSSVNADESLGTFTLAAIYGSLILSNIFLPTIVIKWFGCKWTIALAFLTYVPFIASQFHPRFYTMIPSGLFVGFGGGPLWCAKCTYLSIIAEAYSQITEEAAALIVTRFFGVFFMFYQFSQVWGNLISSAVLSSGKNIVAMNVSAESDECLSIHSCKENTEDLCGANFYPGITTGVNPNLDPPPSEKIQLIAGIYLACMVIACLCVVFGVDSLKRYKRNRAGSATGLSGLTLLIVTLKHLFNPYQLLILPITMFIGAEQAFIAADFNASFVSCGWGISNIGFVMICFGAVNAIAAIFAGGISKKTGRVPMIAFAFVVHVGLLITLLIWKPTSINKVPFFVVAGLWGLCDAVWLVQINALCGILFPGKEEAAYSNFRLWESTGSVITYAYSPYLRTDAKIYLLLTLLVIGVGAYGTIELIERKAKRDTLVTAKTNFELVNGKLRALEINE